MPFDRPTLTALIERILTDMGTRIDGADTALPRGNIPAFSRIHAGATHTLHGYLRWVAEQLLADSAEAEYLERHASIWGIVRNPAEQATGQCEATGTDGTLIPAGTILQRADGEEFSTDSAVTVSGGTATLDLTASDGGTDGNTSAAASLSFMSPIAGVDTTATVDADGLTGGVDEETDEELRLRVLARIQAAPHGGSPHDYVAWAKEVSGVTRAWCVERPYGKGTVALVFVRDNDGSGVDIIPDATEIDEVEAYLLDHYDPATGVRTGKPVGAALYVYGPTPVMVDFEISLTVEDGHDLATVKAAIQDALEDLIYEKGTPSGVLYLSQINEAISATIGEEDHTLISPASNVVLSTMDMAFLNSITWS